MARDPNSSFFDSILGEKPWDGVSLGADEREMIEDDLKYCQVDAVV